MDKIIAFILSLITALPLYFGTAGSKDYNKTTGLRHSSTRLI